MASFNDRLNPLYAINECSSCGALYTADFCCSKGGLEDKILVLLETENQSLVASVKAQMSIQDMEDLKQQYLDEMKTLINEKDYRSGRIDIEIKINELKENFNEMNAVDSLIMEDEHLDTIPEMESDEFIKSSVENLVPTPSESEDFSDIESECDVPDCDDSQTTNFSTFSNPLFDDSTSSDDESSHEEVIHEMSFKTYSNPLFDLDKEIISSEFNPIHNEDLDSTPKDVRFDAKSYLLESLVNHDTLMASPPRFDFLLDEFADELTRCKDPFSLRNHTIPPGIESDDFDSEDNDNSTSRPEFESFHVDYPDSGDSTIDVVEDIPVDVPNILPTHPALQLDFDFIYSNDLGSDLDVSSPSGDRNKIYDPGICIEVESTGILAPLPPVIYTLLTFSFENEDKVFNHGVLAPKEKSPPSLHRGFKASKVFHQKSPMLIHGDNTPDLGV
ncbi:hypothetical protein Tco_0074146, partial [Tanacetum coccineum]